MIRESYFWKRAKSKGKHIGRPANLNEGLTHLIKYMKEQEVGIKKNCKRIKGWCSYCI